MSRSHREIADDPGRAEPTRHNFGEADEEPSHYRRESGPVDAGGRLTAAGRPARAWRRRGVPRRTNHGRAAGASVRRKRGCPAGSGTSRSTLHRPRASGRASPPSGWWRAKGTLQATQSKRAGSSKCLDRGDDVQKPPGRGGSSRIPWRGLGFARRWPASWAMRECDGRPRPAFRAGPSRRPRDRGAVETCCRREFPFVQKKFEFISFIYLWIIYIRLSIMGPPPGGGVPSPPIADSHHGNSVANILRADVECRPSGSRHRPSPAQPLSSAASRALTSPISTKPDGGRHGSG